MNGERGYGAHVDMNDISSTLNSTRVLRLALNVLWDSLDSLPSDTDSGLVGDALKSVHDRITEIETGQLRLFGLADHYLIIRPVSPVSPPPPEIMEKITAAVRTLTGLGMVVGQHDAGYRE